MHCCIVNCWIVYRKLAQPTEPDLYLILGNFHKNRGPSIVLFFLYLYLLYQYLHLSVLVQNHWKFRFVTLPQKIPDKMKLHPWNLRNLCYFPWKLQGLYPGLVEIPHDFFLITPINSFSWPPEFQYVI